MVRHKYNATPRLFPSGTAPVVTSFSLDLSLRVSNRPKCEDGRYLSLMCFFVVELITCRCFSLSYIYNQRLQSSARGRACCTGCSERAAAERRSQNGYAVPASSGSAGLTLRAWREARTKAPHSLTVRRNGAAQQAARTDISDITHSSGRFNRASPRVPRSLSLPVGVCHVI